MRDDPGGGAFTVKDVDNDAKTRLGSGECAASIPFRSQSPSEFQRLFGIAIPPANANKAPLPGGIFHRANNF